MRMKAPSLAGFSSSRLCAFAVRFRFNILLRHPDFRARLLVRNLEPLAPGQAAAITSANVPSRFFHVRIVNDTDLELDIVGEM